MYYKANKLRELRENRKLSQKEVAKAVFMSQTAYSSLENGKNKVDIDKLLLLAKFYNVNPTDLVENNSLSMIFNDKVENGYASFIETLNTENKELFDALKKQLEIKDNQIQQKDTQIEQLLKIIAQN
jgi:transcriptional regulator with XRE-family HTH domain